MQRTSEIGSQLAVAPAGMPKAPVLPDLDALVNKADLSQQRTELALITFATAPAGSARRELFDRVMSGQDVDKAVDTVKTSRGLTISGEDRSHLKEYQLKNFLVAPRIELGPSVYSQVANPALDRSAGVYATPDACTVPVESRLTPVQLQAVEAYKTKLGSEIIEANGVLSSLESHPAPGVPEYDRAHQAALAEYQKLTHGTSLSPAMMGMAQARERAQQQLLLIESDPAVAARVTPQLKEHYTTVARGGDSSAKLPAPKAFEGVSDQGIKTTLAEKEFALAGQRALSQMRSRDVAMWTPQDHDNARELADLQKSVTALKMEQVRRTMTPEAGTGIPRPTVNGRFDGMERPSDLPLSRERTIQLALLAEPGPNNEPLIHELKYLPKDLPELNSEALTLMHQDRQRALAQHQASLNAPLAEVPKPGPTLAESGLGLDAADLAAPPFLGDGPAGLPPMDPPEDDGFGGGGPGGPGGPGNGGLGTQSFDPVNRFRPAILSPETHGSAELLKQIQALEAQAQARIRQERLFTQISAAGAILTAVVAIGAEVATAPMNPHSDPGKALGHAATAMNTVGMGVGQHLRQKVHERSKADSDIKQLIDTYTKEQRGHADMWVDTLSNQMNHLEHLVPPVAEIDRLERMVADSLHQNHNFKADYEDSRDFNAYRIHMAAADEMILSSNPELRDTGLRVAESLRSDPNLEHGDWKTLQNHVATLNVGDTSKVAGPQLGTYETYLHEMEQQSYVSALQLKSREAIAGALAKGELGVLIGDEARAQALLAASRSTDPTEPRTPAQMLMYALDEKHKIERSIQASWRDLAARSPIHAERAAHGEKDPANQLAHLYGRRTLEAKTPDRAAVEGLRDYFQYESQLQLGHGNRAERYEELGIPRGWGDNTVSGSKVGLASSQNGGSQALLLGFKPNSNEIDSAAIHLFSREGVSTPPTPDLVAQGLSGKAIAEFQNGRQLDPPPHAHVFIDGDDVRKLTVEKLAERIAHDYNGAVKDSYADHAKIQLEHDAIAYAGMKTVGHPLKKGDAVLDMNAHQALVDEYKDRNREAYLSRADILASREAIQAAGARSMASQLKEGRTMGGFNQVVEGNRGHFNYPPHRAALARDPVIGLDGKSGERAKRDLQRLFDQADQSIHAIAGEIKVARDQKHPVKIAKDPELFYKLSDRTAQLAALMDTPANQSQLVGHLTETNRGPYDSALRFLNRNGYGSGHTPTP